MRKSEEVVYEGKLYKVYFKYDSGYLEIMEQEHESSPSLNKVKLVHEQDVIFKNKPLPALGLNWTRSLSRKPHIKCS